MWNAAIDRRPSAIICCATNEDVRHAVRTVRQLGLPFTTRGGGHNVAGNAVQDGALLIDLRRLSNVEFDMSRERVHVGAGARWGEVERPAADLGCAVPTGMISHTGVAGLTLGGGTGYLTRQLGTTSDNLISAEVVLADGDTVRCDESTHPDLFWRFAAPDTTTASSPALSSRRTPSRSRSWCDNQSMLLNIVKRCSACTGSGRPSSLDR